MYCIWGYKMIYIMILVLMYFYSTVCKSISQHVTISNCCNTLQPPWKFFVKHIGKKVLRFCTVKTLKLTSCRHYSEALHFFRQSENLQMNSDQDLHWRMGMVARPPVAALVHSLLKGISATNMILIKFE